MPAAARIAAPARKKRDRPPADAARGPAAKKKKSPLFGEPQNYYAPTAIGSMTSEELSEWRKEQRRERNRASAAASRNKTRARIEELEGEVAGWRSKYLELEGKMRFMERHIELLTKIKMTNPPNRPAAWVPSPPPPMASHPNGPPKFPPPKTKSTHTVAVPNAVVSHVPPPTYLSSIIQTNADPFPPLFSEPKDCALVETQDSAAAAQTYPEPRPHLNKISRQAVKTTGAASSCSEHVRGMQPQRPAFPVRSPPAKKTGGGQGSVIHALSAVSYSDEEVCLQGVKEFEGRGGDGTTASGNAQALPAGRAMGGGEGDGTDVLGACGDDGDEFLDLLVDALDGDFDPDLLI